MILDQIAILSRFIILTVLAIISQLAFHRGQYKVMIWSLAFWLSTFRLLVIRVIRLYPHQSDALLPKFQYELMFGIIPVITDLFLVVGVIVMYFWLVETYQQWKKETNVQVKV